MDQNKKKHIVFVDDEYMILQGLRRMLRSKRNDWDMSFITSAAEALSILEHKEADVIVSDMRMPEMNGAEFLRIVSKEYPNTVRIILSGYAEKKYVYQTVGPTHQYLAKPCAPEVLIETIDKILMRRDQLDQSQDIVNFSTKLGHVATLPNTYKELITELKKDQPSDNALSRIMGRDIGLTAEILKLTNSSYFTLGDKIIRPIEAVHVLGVEVIEKLVMEFGVFDSYQADENQMETVRRISHTGFQVGIGAKLIANMEGMVGDFEDIAFCAGSLSVLGALIMAMYDHDRYVEFKKAVVQNDQFYADMQVEFWGCHQGKLGAYHAALWGFSEPIVRIIEYTMQPSLSDRNGNEKEDPLWAVHASRALLSSKLGIGNVPLDVDYLSQLDFVDKISSWQERM